MEDYQWFNRMDELIGTLRKRMPYAVWSYDLQFMTREQYLTPRIMVIGRMIMGLGLYRFSTMVDGVAIIASEQDQGPIVDHVITSFFAGLKDHSIWDNLPHVPDGTFYVVIDDEIYAGISQMATQYDEEADEPVIVLRDIDWVTLT